MTGQVVKTPYGEAVLHYGSYDNGAIAVQLMSADGSGERIAVLSVNLPDHAADLGPGEFFAKTWSENERVARCVLEAELFEDTGRRVATGFVQAQVWRIVKEQEAAAPPKTFQLYVLEQAGDMVAELKAHEEEKGAPGSWFIADPRRWCREADSQLLLLRGAIYAGHDEAEIRKRAAHVCNFVMMANQAARHNLTGERNHAEEEGPGEEGSTPDI